MQQLRRTTTSVSVLLYFAVLAVLVAAMTVLPPVQANAGLRSSAATLRRPRNRALRRLVNKAMNRECFTTRRERRAVRGHKHYSVTQRPCSEDGITQDGVMTEILVSMRKDRSRKLGMIQVGCDGTTVEAVVCGPPCETSDDCSGGDEQCHASAVVGYQTCGPYTPVGETCGGPVAQVLGQPPNKCHPRTALCVPSDPSTPDAFAAEIAAIGHEPVLVDYGANLDGSNGPPSQTNQGGAIDLDGGNAGTADPVDGTGTNDIYHLTPEEIDSRAARLDGSGRRSLLGLAEVVPSLATEQPEGTCMQVCDVDTPCTSDDTWCRITSITMPGLYEAIADPDENQAAFNFADAAPQVDEVTAVKEFYSVCVPYAELGQPCDFFIHPELQEKCNPASAVCVVEDRGVADIGGKCRKKCTPRSDPAFDPTDDSMACSAGEFCGDDGICWNSCEQDSDCSDYTGPADAGSGTESFTVPSANYWCRPNKAGTMGLCTVKKGLEEDCSEDIESSETPWAVEKCVDTMKCIEGKCAYSDA